MDVAVSGNSLVFLRERHEMCRGTHAEQNAIIQAALHGVSTAGATLYCTHQPCILCAKMLINAGVTKVVFRGEYPDGLALKLMNEAGLELIRQAVGEG